MDIFYIELFSGSEEEEMYSFPHKELFRSKDEAVKHLEDRDFTYEKTWNVNDIEQIVYRKHVKDWYMEKHSAVILKLFLPGMTTKGA